MVSKKVNKEFIVLISMALHDIFKSSKNDEAENLSQ